MAHVSESDDNAAILIAYGSNLPSAPALPVRQSASQGLRWVVKSLQDQGIVVAKISRLWQSQAWPDPSDPPYFNAVMQVTTSLQPAELLNLLHDLENKSGRVRNDRINAPRVLDLDLVCHGRIVMQSIAGLTIPHPRAHDRAFVMGPITDILPYWRHPVLPDDATTLFANARIGKDAYPLEADD